VIRTQLFLKVEYDHEDARDGQKLAQEIARAVKRVYGVRTVEISNMMSEEYGSKDDD
jgi:predicted TIM-barrel fold metal-dependent hydrolase